jgi:DNA invertase Pin-like site-specific DNA recombinase
MERFTAIYVRVSSNKQDTRSQTPDLERWAKAYADGGVRWYRDSASGKTMDRPGWKKLEADIATGAVARVVVWRLDRLGRTASGLTTLFDDLRRRGVTLVSVRDGLDLETPAGRLMANVLASVAAYETEIRGERIAAGQAAARAKGKTWGGSKPGRKIRATAEKQAAIKQLRADGASIASIARTVGLSRPTIYGVLDDASE